MRYALVVLVLGMVFLGFSTLQAEKALSKGKKMEPRVFEMRTYFAAKGKARIYTIFSSATLASCGLQKPIKVMPCFLNICTV